jgi:hypothetical protein
MARHWDKAASSPPHIYFTAYPITVYLLTNGPA